MAILCDTNVRAALERSNIETSSWDRQSTLLEGTLTKANLPASEVVALSQAETSLKPDGSSMGTQTTLLVVFKAGLAMAEEKGIFSKRIDLQTVSYKSISAVVPDEKLYDRGRGEMAIQGMVGGSIPLFRIGWNWSQGGQTSAAAAAAERDRILSAIQRAMQGDWASPSSGQAGIAHAEDASFSQYATARPGPATGARPRDPTAESPPPKKEYLINWTAALFREAGVAPVREHVEKVAKIVAIGLFVDRIVRYADARPLPALQRYCRSLPGELTDRLDQLDEIYATCIRLGAEADARTQDHSDPTYLRLCRRHTELLDQTIDRFLAAMRDEVIEGIRGDYG